MIGLDSYSRRVFNYLDPNLIYISLWIDWLSIWNSQNCSVSSGFRCRVITGSLMRLYWPKLRSMTHLLSYEFWFLFNSSQGTFEIAMFCLYIIMCFLPVHRYSVVNFTFSGPLGLLDSTLLFGSRVAFNPGLRAALNPGLGGVRDVAPAIISHEQTQ